MKHFVLLALAVYTTLLSACASEDERAVTQVVIDAERALEDAINSKSNVAPIEEYFATPEEGAISAGLAETRDRWRTWVNAHVGGASLVQISNFRINSVSVHTSGNLARVTYQMDIRMVHGTQQGSATLTQNLALTKTARRGWRISGGDTPQLSNLVGKLPLDR